MPKDAQARGLLQMELMGLPTAQGGCFAGGEGGGEGGGGALHKARVGSTPRCEAKCPWLLCCMSRFVRIFLCESSISLQALNSPQIKHFMKLLDELCDAPYTRQQGEVFLQSHHLLQLCLLRCFSGLVLQTKIRIQTSTDPWDGG